MISNLPTYNYIPKNASICLQTHKQNITSRFSKVLFNQAQITVICSSGFFSMYLKLQHNMVKASFLFLFLYLKRKWLFINIRHLTLFPHYSNFYVGKNCIITQKQMLDNDDAKIKSSPWVLA